jgi:hypothetical protein
MQHGTLGAVAASIVVLSGGIASVQEVSQSSLSRTLSVEQTAIYNVKPTPQPGGLNVVTWVDRPDYAYAEGEDVKFFVKTSKDAYVTILNVDPAGQTTILFPNQYQPTNLVQADRVLEVPDSASQSRIVVSGTMGTELIKVIASREPIDPFEARQLAAAGPYQMVRARAQGVARSLTVTMLGEEPDPAGQIFPSIKPVRSAEWAVCHQTLSTIPALSASLRTRSLVVTRTSESDGSVTCEESAR